MMHLLLKSNHISLCGRFNAGIAVLDPTDSVVVRLLHCLWVV